MVVQENPPKLENCIEGSSVYFWVGIAKVFYCT